MPTIFPDITPNAPLTLNNQRGNLNVQFDLTGQQVIVSDCWQLGARLVQFIWLPAGARVAAPGQRGACYVKVIIGGLAKPAQSPFCEPGTLQDTQLQEDTVIAAAQGALLAVFLLPEERDGAVHAPADLAIQGPRSEVLKWRTFDQHFEHVTRAFAGMDAFIGPGFHLLDESGAEICYLNLWAAGKGVDLTTHNHGHPPSETAPAFVETHLTLSNGTGEGGMYLADEPGAPERQKFPVPTGFEHGPFFDFDASTGKPLLRENGAVSYPWHGWQSGHGSGPDQAYDFVAAFETAPEYVRL